MVWEPAQYIYGNYFQNELSNAFLRDFKIKPFGHILDVGCGDGQYSSLLADKLKRGHILGIDNSEKMIKHANQHWARNNLSFETHNIRRFRSAIPFDFVLSFWCLHWTNIDLSFPNIFNLLNNKGRLYAVFSSFSENSILQVLQELAKKNCYSALTDRYLNDNRKHTTYFYRVVNILNQLPFKQVKLELKTTLVHFPNLHYFKNLLLTMPFLGTFPVELVDVLLDDMLDIFQNICQRKYEGALYYETRPIFLEAIK